MLSEEAWSSNPILLTFHCLPYRRGGGVSLHPEVGIYKSCRPRYRSCEEKINLSDSVVSTFFV